MSDEEATARALTELEQVLRPFLRGTRGAPAELANGDCDAVAAYWEHLSRWALPPRRRQASVACVAKRAFDIVGAAALLVLLSPVLVLIAVAVKLTGRGEVFFGHERVGVGGRPFRCWKFRTMVAGTYASLQTDDARWRYYVDSDFKIPALDDPRVTSLGAFLRRYRLDELPQLWNVLRGELSLVGPRPLVRLELLWYGPLAEELLSVRPGMTGAWQVTKGSAYPQRALVELAYVRSMSFRQDIAILARTLRKVIEKEGVSELLHEPLHESSEDRANLGEVPLDA